MHPSRLCWQYFFCCFDAFDVRCAREISFFHSLYHNVRRKVMELCWNRRKGASKYQQWLWLEYKPKIFVFVFIHRQRDLWGIRWHADVDVKWALSGQHGNRKEKEINVHVDEHVKWSRISRWNGQCIYSSRVGVAIDGINTDKSGYPWKKCLFYPLYPYNFIPSIIILHFNSAALIFLRFLRPTNRCLKITIIFRSFPPSHPLPHRALFISYQIC